MLVIDKTVHLIMFSALLQFNLNDQNTEHTSTFRPGALQAIVELRTAGIVHAYSNQASALGFVHYL